MKLFYLFLLLLVAGSLNRAMCQAQPITAIWAKGSQGSAYTYVQSTSMATDSRGYIYQTGYIAADTLKFGGLTYNRQNNSGSFLVKYDPTGQAVWITGCYGPSANSPFRVHTDAQDNVYWLTLVYTDTFFVSWRCELIKFDSAGQVLWRDTLPLSSGWMRDISVDNNGNVVMGGIFRGDSVVIGHDTLLGNPGMGYDMVITKYNTLGVPVWARTDAPFHARATGSTIDAVTSDQSGNVYAAIAFADSINLGTGSTYAGNPNLGYYLMAQYSPAGQYLRGILFSGCNRITTMATDKEGNIYITGAASDSFSIGGQFIYNVVNYTQANMFVAKLNNAGQLLWARCAVSTPYGFNIGTGLLPGGTNYLYVSGYMEDTTVWAGDSLFTPSQTGVAWSSFVMTLDATDGHMVCGQAFKEGGFGNVNIASRPDGSLCIASTFADTILSIGADTLSSRSLQGNVYIAALSPCPLTSTGISTVHPHSAFTLRPNPSNGNATVSYTLPDGAADGSLHITDLLGKEIKNYSVQNSQIEVQVDVREFSGGIYIVLLVSAGQVVGTAKMVVE